MQAAVDAAGAVVRDGVYDAETCRGVLHSAAGGGQIAALELLLAAGAPVDAKDGSGLTALQVAHAQLGPRLSSIKHMCLLSKRVCSPAVCLWYVFCVSAALELLRGRARPRFCRQG